MAFKGIDEVRFGVGMFRADFGIGSLGVAHRAKERGMGEFLPRASMHIPDIWRAPSLGGELSRDCWHVHPPLATLAAVPAAARTRSGFDNLGRVYEGSGRRDRKIEGGNLGLFGDPADSDHDKVNPALCSARVAAVNG